MKKRTRATIGIFQKLAFLYIGVGILPLLLIGKIFFKEFSENTKNILINDAATILQSASGYVDTMLTDWEKETISLYSLQVQGKLYLSDVLSKDKFSEKEKKVMIQRYLSKMGSVNGLKSIRFLDKEGTLYYVSEVVGKIVNQPVMNQWIEEERAKITMERGITVSTIHRDTYFSNINHEVITVKRNLYDVSSIKTLDSYLGSVYLDINKGVIVQQLADVNLGSKSGLYIINHEGEEIYPNENQKELSSEIITRVLDAVDGGNIQYIEDATSYYLYQKNTMGGWISLVRIHKEDIIENMKTTERYIMTVLLVSAVLFLTLYLLFSEQISTSIRKLKAGMEKIQQGELETRVHIKSKDEIGVLAEGLNQMASQLNTYIERVYGAEIKQKEAELNALKTQIKPHYLYNTLDVIRMTAINNEDRQTAGMIESLARQLRYLMGNENDVVPLRRELENISDYFTLVRTRYEERIDLNISVPEKLKSAVVLKLILQPIIENAIKHGLKPKVGHGTVWITAKQAEGVLELTVMDDGVGMAKETIDRISDGVTGGIGIRNVRERIVKNYGTEYGMEVHSTLGAGTIVMVRVPYSEEGIENAEGDIN